jgi:competence protein ComEC
MVSFIILPLTLGATLLFSYAPQLSQPLLELSASLITRIIQWSKSFAAGPLAGEYVYLCIWEFAAFTFACAGLVLWGARRRNPGLACLSAAAVLLIFGIYAHDRESTLRLSALSIGQADSFIIQTPENKNYLVDGGGLYSDSFDTGSQLIAPALQRLGITSLDAVILTHDHPDHSKGLQHILRYFPTKAFMSGIRLRDLNPELREVLDHPEAPAQSTLPEGLIALDEYIYLHVPKQNHPEVNERSIAVFGGYGTEGFLLTGDLEREGMARLFKIEPPTPVTLFKLPHHGSRNSLPGRWLQTWDIHQALVSCGRFNRFGFPHTHICDLLENAGIPLWRTDTHGTLNFSTDGSGWVTKTHPTVRTNP